MSLSLILTRCSGLAEHALHPGAIAARLGSKERLRAARGEATRVGRWLPWLDSNGVTLFVYAAVRSGYLLRTVACYKYLVPVPGIDVVRVVSVLNEKSERLVFT